MKILISNDDGYLAPGIIALVKAISTDGHAVTVVAPEQNRSAASNSLTVQNPLRVYTADNGYHYVNGTPSDCVHLATSGLFAENHDMVLSGINAGANLGDDVIYSGTVAAAVEGRFLGYPAIAISLLGPRPKFYATAAHVAQNLVKRIAKFPLPADTILNVNVPNVDLNSIAGWQVTRLGNRHRAEQMVEDKDPRGERVFWIGPPGPEQDSGPGTDFYAVANNYVSITPLKIDLTHTEQIETLQDWLLQ